ncbi:hypothetical protein CAPTEDRAFT_215519 [Capitella teleta]|uniref:Uncharacterized protein n=1 Tax=Capitella teleta TaxID=283909 RepID=R7VEC6_CAPTE|nr:hypothetical protein CAPTEDRAFT_215519 [Capitella teleta]|eukprot:ELU14646.1 hypothetical protein CAPTEDRAFT_215519 [Capitella teleta]
MVSGRNFTGCWLLRYQKCKKLHSIQQARPLRKIWKWLHHRQRRRPWTPFLERNLHVVICANPPNPTKKCTPTLPEQARLEVKGYTALPGILLSSCPFAWWKTQASTFPLLSNFATHERASLNSALWPALFDCAIGPWKPRKESSNKPRQEFEIDDIFDALSKLDEASVKPVIHVPALDLDLLPPMNPAQLLPVIFLDKMNEMEAKMAAMQAQIDNLGKREQLCGHGRNEMAHRSTSMSDSRKSTGQQTKTRPAVPNPAGPAPPSMSAGSHAKSPPQDPERWPDRQDTASTSVKRVDTGEEETKQEHSYEWTEVVKRKSKKNPLKGRENWLKMDFESLFDAPKMIPMPGPHKEYHP